MAVYVVGIFQSKRKWGATESVPSHEHKRIWIRIQRNTPAVSHFLKSNPCVIIGREERIARSIVADEPDQVTPDTGSGWRKQYATSGLNDLLIRSVRDLMEKP